MKNKLTNLKKLVPGFIFEIKPESGDIVSVETNLGHKISIGDTVVSNSASTIPKGKHGEVVRIYEHHIKGDVRCVLVCNFDGKICEITHEGLLLKDNNYVVNKKYRLGNQPDEYELFTKYLGWLPEGYKTWESLFFPFVSSRQEGNKQVVIISPDKKDKANIILHYRIIKDAFPMSFLLEERSKNWHHFCIVSNKENLDKKFIIPLH